MDQKRKSFKSRLLEEKKKYRFARKKKILKAQVL